MVKPGGNFLIEVEVEEGGGSKRIKISIIQIPPYVQL